MMILTEAKKEQIKESIVEKANKNKERQAYIRPSEFGFDRNSDDTHAFLDILPHILKYSSAKIIGKDLIDIQL